MTRTRNFSALGPAPYRFTSYDAREARVQRNADLAREGLLHTTNACGGSCDACGTAIFNVFHFRAANGATFKLGSTCADALVETMEWDSDDGARARRAVRGAKKARKLALDNQRVEIGREFVATHRDELQQHDHPYDRIPRGRSLLTFVDRLLSAPVGADAHQVSVARKCAAIKSAYKALGARAPRLKGGVLA